jgi:hypothetical protein
MSVLNNPSNQKMRLQVRKQIGSAVAVLVLGVSGWLMALPGTAGAAGSGSSSSPTTTTPTSCSTSASVTVTVANTSSNPVTGTLTASCTFAPGATVTINNAGANQTAPAGGDGTLTISYAATDPSISIDNGAFQPAVAGVNTITATGVNSNGGTNTATFLIDLITPSSATGAGSGSGTGSGGLAFTGADLAALVAASLALILMGSGVVIYTRRRAASVK